MRTLFLLRHAKSSWDDPGISDIDRPLNARGLNAAAFMGEYAARRGLIPDLIIASPARRTAQTADIFREHSGFNVPIHFDERIYEASVGALMNVIAAVAENVESIMIVGHNPGIEGLIRHLTGKIEPMPTAALAVIELEERSVAGKLKEVIRPKEAQK